MICELIYNKPINNEIFRLDFIWQTAEKKLAPPRAGQFFMIKPKHSGVFLGRPISVARWEPAATDRDFIRRKARSKRTPYQRYLTGKYLESDTVSFLIARRGQGTRELAAMHPGDDAELIGPLGNAWMDFLPIAKNDDKNPIALVGGGIGLAPLNALLLEKIICEISEYRFDIYAGFRTGFKNDEEKFALLGTCLEADNVIISTEDGKGGRKGLIPDFLEPGHYAAVCACGPEPMLKAVAEKCKIAEVPCFVSMERRMACGVGACLGCTVKTVSGNRRCCADGPIFKADEVIFDG